MSFGLTRKELGALAFAGACAVSVPTLAAHLVDARVADRVEPALERGIGSTVTIGGVDASLLGTLRLEDVAVGGVFEAAAVEASVDPSSALSGRVRASEIRIESPRVHAYVDESGHSNVERLLRKALHRAQRSVPSAKRGADRPRRLRRIVVTGGDLIVDIGGGRLRVSGVEISPKPGGVRAVATGASARIPVGDLSVGAEFSRVAADLSLPSVEIERLLAAAGTVTLASEGDSVVLHNVAISRGLAGGDRLRLSGLIDRSGADPRLDVEIERDGGAVTAHFSGDEIPLAVLSPLVPDWVLLRSTSVSGRATVALGRDLDFDVALAAEDLVVDHPSVASAPVWLSGEIAARGAMRRVNGRRYVELSEARFKSGKLAVSASGMAEFSPARALPERAELSFSLPRATCAGAIASLPEPFRAKLAGFDATGTLAGSMSVSFDRLDPAAAQLDIDIDVDNCKVHTEPSGGDPTALRKSFDHTFPDGSRARIGKDGDDYTALRRLPRHVVAAWISAEDARYYEHPGFDAVQIERSLAINLAQGRLIRGGSTISQQLVKNVFLEPERTLARKLQEAVLTWRLESRLSKREILERYFNIIELGDGVFGLSRASQHWFGKSPRRLTVREAAFLAALTPAPRTLSKRIRELGRIDDYTKQRIGVVLRAMRRNRFIDGTQYHRAKHSKLKLRRELASR